jgi:hypothetical protein
MNGLLIQMQQSGQEQDAGLVLVNQTARAMPLHTDSQYQL